MVSNVRKTDEATQQVENLLQTEYAAKHGQASVEVYRYNPGSIRVRIIGSDFQPKPVYDREDEIWKTLEALPDSVYQQISMLLLLTPNEAKTSLANIEFEDPSPSML